LRFNKVRKNIKSEYLCDDFSEDIKIDKILKAGWILKFSRLHRWIERK
jgi:hypothetical protein